MGFLRILLACIVLGGHLGLSDVKDSIFVFNAKLAVECFFVISGFYMALILNEKYIGKNGSYWLFLTNRILRIYPIYWVILIITFIIYARHLPLHLGPDAVFYTLKNIFIFWDPNYFIQGKNGVNYYLLVTQAWSVGLEMMFYALSPFILRSWKKILFVFFISIVMKYVGSHEYFTENFIFFMLGAASYLLYAKVRQYDFYQTNKTKIILGLLTSIFLLPYLFVVSSLPITNERSNILSVFYFSAFAISIPFLFLLSARNKLDRFVGELSYPMYIAHGIILHILHRLTFINYWVYVVVSIIVVLWASRLLYLYIDKPIEQYRAKRVQKIKKKLPK